jgi:hypothetical protein
MFSATSLNVFLHFANVLGGDALDLENVLDLLVREQEHYPDRVFRIAGCLDLDSVHALGLLTQIHL